MCVLHIESNGSSGAIVRSDCDLKGHLLFLRRLLVRCAFKAVEGGARYVSVYLYFQLLSNVVVLESNTCDCFFRSVT